MLRWIWIPETALVVGHALAIAVIVAEGVRLWRLSSFFFPTHSGNLSIPNSLAQHRHKYGQITSFRKMHYHNRRPHHCHSRALETVGVLMIGEKAMTLILHARSESALRQDATINLRYYRSVNLESR